LSRLSPDAFSHPVWIYFGRSTAPEAIQALLSAAQNIETEDNIRDACQLLLICSVLQYRSCDYDSAFASTQQSLTLAKNHNLSQVICWSIWGLSAIMAQLGQFQDAAEYLKCLQTELNKQREWVLGNLVEIIYQYLMQDSNTMPSTLTVSPLSAPSNTPCQDLLDCLSLWGISPQELIASGRDNNKQRFHNSGFPAVSNLFSRESWRMQWLMIKRATYHLASHPSQKIILMW
jgi:hypothetical protein